MTLYGIRNITTKKPLRLSIFSNEGGEFCNAAGATFETSDWHYVVYMVSDIDVAHAALKNDPKWYNASIECPRWPSKFNPLDYEVFEVNL
jgi:hypothetical protein